MLDITAQSFRSAVVLRCSGRIVIGYDSYMLRKMATSNPHAKTVILDLARVDRIDARGLGILLALRKWARDKSISFKLMNVVGYVEEILALTKLNQVFEICSVREMLSLLFSGKSGTGGEAVPVHPASVSDVGSELRSFF